ncbi:hypothetical protein O3G_MSEX001754 [Manduca sexta]|uniref:Uncharacterized protein n=1 Tax=Manduca sexta TaxID=7130 RepID=A0A921YLA9_MANSE|nr:hypothetical protein O3G_MSEX001754 [Manduca sexta]KAG6441328.1 hypothetical protein O3G_MSEX001754 [Manduca sexta]
MLKSLRNERSYDVDDEDTTFVASKGDSDLNENKMEMVANVIATSTPQKIAGDRSYTTESNFIGQGDEEIDLEQGHLANSTSVFINNLFDMSEVEHVIFCDDNIAKHITESNELLTQTMTKIMESYINTALGIAFEEHPVNYGVSEIPSRSTEYSEYSFLGDAIPADITKNIGFCIQENTKCVNEHSGDVAATSTMHNPEVSMNAVEEFYVDVNKGDEVALYENTYLTLNRDYEQYSDDGEPILQDPKELTLQEIELMTANTSENDLAHSLEEKEKPEEPITIPAISGVQSASRKVGLVRRCRDQGARIWSRLRGWWRRKTPGKHIKGTRVSTLGHGMCPLSPDARRRAASLLDQRLLRSPSPSRPTIWKFNTVNEALVNSSRWKEYTFDERTDD